MLKSLFSGVSGLQAHQVAMDVEANNIANVNTTGFKYSRANFSDMLAQTKSIATAPQGDLGGKNAVQVGLGTSVTSMTRIFSQGSVQNSDKNTDVAIQGDGFFVVSPDGGNTYKYTRNGDFKFDAAGNFVDNNGFITQGWVRDSETGKVDSTAPITDINIPPGLTTPANPTAEVVLKANLNSGNLIESFSSAYSVPSGTPPSQQIPAIYTGDALDSAGRPIESGDFGVMFNETGEGFSLQDGQGVWIAFEDTKSTATGNVTQGDLDITFAMDDGSLVPVVTTGGTAGTVAQDGNRYAAAINAKAPETGITATYDITNNKLILTNSNSNTLASHNIRISSTGATDQSGFVVADSATTAYSYTYDSAGADPTIGSAKKFRTISDLRYAMEIQARNVGDHDASTYTGADATVPTSDAVVTFDIDGVSLDVNELTTDTEAETAQKYVDVINGAGINGVSASLTGLAITVSNTTNSDVDLTMPGTGNSGLSTTTIVAAGDGVPDESNIEVLVNEQGKFEIHNPGNSQDGDYDLNISVTGYTVGVSENSRFTNSLVALNAALPIGSTGVAYSQSFNAATHSSSIDVFDSLGSKHTLRSEFRKTGLDSSSGSTWSMKLSVPEPGTIDTIEPFNEKVGSVRFTNDGAMATYSPPSVSFTGHNGSSPDQQIKLSFGTANAFDGMTSFDSRSSTSGISQDGFTGGDLVGIRIDQSGTLIGSFSNGRSFGLAQIGMAKFTNNEGLSTEGGSVFIQTSNSGDPIIGTAATAGRGFIQSSALEASNVDLSRSLTQLIIIQRGYQANGKTITTSDTLLETLIGLKR